MVSSADRRRSREAQDDNDRGACPKAPYRPMANGNDGGDPYRRRVADGCRLINLLEEQRNNTPISASITYRTPIMIRGGGDPNTAMASTPSPEWARRLGASPPKRMVLHGPGPNGFNRIQGCGARDAPDSGLPSDQRPATSSAGEQSDGLALDRREPIQGCVKTPVQFPEPASSKRDPAEGCYFEPIFAVPAPESTSASRWGSSATALVQRRAQQHTHLTPASRPVAA
jgi:hypothetical protein